MGSDKKQVKILVGLPCYGGQVFSECVVGLIQLQKAVIEYNEEHKDDSTKPNIDFVVEFLANESLVTRARNTLVAKFLSDETYTHLFFIDADIGFLGGDVLQLVHADQMVIGGVYPKKALDYELIRTYHSMLPNQDNELYEIVSKRYAIELTQDNADNLLTSNNNIVPVRYLPTGFMMIKREVFDILRAKYPDMEYDGFCESRDESLKGHYWLFFDTMIHDNRYLSEDWAFSERCHKADIPIYAHFGFGLNHMGFYKFRGHPGAIRITHSVQKQVADLIAKQEKNVSEEYTNVNSDKKMKSTKVSVTGGKQSSSTALGQKHK